MKAHEEIETLSAYLDREVGEAERARVEAHLASCTDCRDKKLALEGSMKALAGLLEVGPDRDESRAIRLRVLQVAAPRRRAGPYPAHPLRHAQGLGTWGRRLYAAAGVLALVAAGIVGISVLGPGGRSVDRAVFPLRARDTPGQVLEFTSSDQVLAAVAARPEVIRGVRRYRVADVASRQPEALEKAAEAPVPSRESAGRVQQGEDSSPPSVLFEAAPSGEPVQGRSVEECLRETLRSQPYPLIPLLSSAAAFKGEPVWLLVYSWTSSEAANAPLDRVQVWLVSRQDCQERYYSSFKP